MPAEAPELIYHPLSDPDATKEKLARLSQNPESLTDRALFETIFDVFNTRGSGRWSDLDEVQLKIPNRLVYVGGPFDDPSLPYEQSWIQVSEGPTVNTPPTSVGWEEPATFYFRLLKADQKVTVLRQTAFEDADVEMGEDLETAVTLTPEQRGWILDDLIVGNEATPLVELTPDDVVQ